MKRRPNWPEALAAEVRAAQRQPFAWGVNDCCLFVARCLAAMTGEDPSRAFQGYYQDAASAAALLQREFGGGVEQMAEQMAARFGLREKPLPQARRGDVVLLEPRAVGAREIEIPELESVLGILVDARPFFLVPQGLVPLPLCKCRRAWGF